LGLAVGTGILTLIGSEIVESANLHLSNQVWVPDWRWGNTKYNFGFTVESLAECNVNHSSWIVNWHYSGTPSATVKSSIEWVTGVSPAHASHGSHGSY
jgi:hypothetical protein